MSHDPSDHMVEGTVTDVFAHRFVVESAKGKILADLGKHNQDRIAIKSGDKVELAGEQKPSELKIRTMILNGKDVALAAKDKHADDKHRHHEHEKSADPHIALQTARNENVTVIGKPHRKAEHFEVLGKTAKSELVELHIELDGTLRHSKPVKPDSEKWAQELAAA